MSTPLRTQAVTAALANNWQEACTVNIQLLSQNPHDIDSLNRLAFAYMKLGKFKKAKDTYKLVVEKDATNPIAIKNLKRLEMVSKHIKSDQDAPPNQNPAIAADSFIEEAGKTKTVELKNVADKKTLSYVQPGDPVVIVVKRSKIFIQAIDKKYIGVLPDSLGLRLVTFMKGGNIYSAYIKACDEKNVTIFIKEIKKVSKFKNQSSFSMNYSTALSDSD